MTRWPFVMIGILFLLLVLLLPPIRRMWLEILPLGRKPDDIAFWVVLAMLVIFATYSMTIERWRVSRRKRRLKRERVGLLEQRIRMLCDNLYQWVVWPATGKTVKESILCSIDRSPEAVSRAQKIQQIVNQASVTVESLGKLDEKNLEELEEVYLSLVGNSSEPIRWLELETMLDKQALELPRSNETSSLVLIQHQHQGDWRLDELLPKRNEGRVKGALGLLLESRKGEGR